MARRHKLPVLIVGNSSQNLKRHIRKSDPQQETEGFWVEVATVGIGADSADFFIVESLRQRDIVITQDIGLAAMVLGKGAFALGVRGREYLPETIDLSLEIRHVEKKLRRQGRRTGGPAPFTDEDREYFTGALERVIEKALNR